MSKQLDQTTSNPANSDYPDYLRQFDQTVEFADRDPERLWPAHNKAKFDDRFLQYELDGAGDIGFKVSPEDLVFDLVSGQQFAAARKASHKDRLGKERQDSPSRRLYNMEQVQMFTNHKDENGELTSTATYGVDLNTATVVGLNRRAKNAKTGLIESGAVSTLTGERAKRAHEIVVKRAAKVLGDAAIAYNESEIEKAKSELEDFKISRKKVT